MAVRIGLASLLRNRMGSVALPEEVRLACPRCGEAVADDGNCLVEISGVVNPEEKRLEAKLHVDCRTCGYDGENPVVLEG